MPRRGSRQLAWVALIPACLALAGCGAGAPSGETLAQRLVGEWALQRYTKNGGEKWFRPGNLVTVAFAADGTWSDSLGHRGSYELAGDGLALAYRDGRRQAYRFELERMPDRLRLSGAARSGREQYRFEYVWYGR